MPKRAHSSSAANIPDHHSTPADRVTWLLKQVWSDNRSAMARDIGVTHSVLTKIASGTQAPGRQVLSKLAEHPKVNPTWLLTGSGEPLLVKNDSPEEGWPLPIAAQALPGDMEKFRALLSGESFPVAGAFYRPSRYWLRVSVHEPLAKVPQAALNIDDLVLLETDPIFWNHGEMVDKRIVAVRSCDKDRPPRLGLAAWRPKTSTNAACLTVNFANERMPSAETLDQVFQKLASGQPWHATADEQQVFKSFVYRHNPNELSAHLPWVTSEAIQLSDILAVSVLVVHTFR